MPVNPPLQRCTFLAHVRRGATCDHAVCVCVCSVGTSWDELNRFCSYFKVPKADALELRRYYIERADTAKANSRKRVMLDFSPLLADRFVWKLNQAWLVRASR